MHPNLPTGTLAKLIGTLHDDGLVHYHLPVGDKVLDLNAAIGKKLTLSFTGKITCKNCQKTTKKSYSQGFCYVCMTKLAQCDMCIMKPETCHYHLGTCREPSWGEQHCMAPHYVYLANTSGLKVGITRETQIPTRWIDQGAVQALPIFKVKSRIVSGLVEVALAEFLADKTNWRVMLRGKPELLDLPQIAQELLPQISDKLKDISLIYGEDAIEVLNEEMVNLAFPVNVYLTKISSFNFDKTPEVSGILQGIKGQYLIFDKGVINIRKFGSYIIQAELS